MSRREPIRVLYMEDDPGTARLVEARLRVEGYDVALARDGEEGLAMAADGGYDIVALDHGMPVHDGLEVLRILSSRGSLPPTIMVTGRGDEAVAVEAMKLGACDYLVKDSEGAFVDLLPTVIAQAMAARAAERREREAREALEAEVRERVLAEEKLRRKLADQTALYQASQAFLGQVDLETTLADVCQLAVERFGLKMAWVGLIDEQSFEVRPASSYGCEESYLAAIRVTWDQSPTGRGPTGTAIRTARAVAMNRIDTDPTHAPWRAAALEWGYRSSAALPLCRGDQVLGALCTYSAEPEHFTADRLLVLQSFANLAALALEGARLFHQVARHADELERRVAERTRDLSQANERLRREIVERQQLQAQFLQAQKLESLGLLAGGVAHDFNNLLTAILGNAGLMLMRMRPEAENFRLLREIERAAQRAAELTDQLLTYAGKHEAAIRPIDLADVVEEMTHLLKISVSKQVEVKLDFPSGLPAIEGDPAQIRQVVMNLILNASDAIGQGHGVISLRTYRLDEDRGELAATCFDEELGARPYVVLEVSDTGCGMDEETKAKMFDPFFTTKATGRGLGMASVLGIVRTHRGTINVCTEPGQGTTFQVLFPAAGPAAPAEPAA